MEWRNQLAGAMGNRGWGSNRGNRKNQRRMNKQLRRQQRRSNRGGGRDMSGQLAPAGPALGGGQVGDLNNPGTMLQPGTNPYGPTHAGGNVWGPSPGGSMPSQPQPWQPQPAPGQPRPSREDLRNRRPGGLDSRGNPGQNPYTPGQLNPVSPQPDPYGLNRNPTRIGTPLPGGYTPGSQWGGGDTMPVQPTQPPITDNQLQPTPWGSSPGGPTQPIQPDPWGSSPGGPMPTDPGTPWQPQPIPVPETSPPPSRDPGTMYLQPAQPATPAPTYNNKWGG